MPTGKCSPSKSIKQIFLPDFIPVPNQKRNRGGREEAMQAFTEIRQGADDEANEDSALIWNRDYTTPFDLKLSMADSSYPSAFRISCVCSPRSGGGVTSPG